MAGDKAKAGFENARMKSDNTVEWQSVSVETQGLTAAQFAKRSDKTCYLTLQRGSFGGQLGPIGAF